MCGLVGELRFDGKPPDEAVIAAMRDRLVHRGPDAAGVWISPGGRAGLGYRRLGIIDLSPRGNQPMGNEDGSVQLVFNGEIYNFRDLAARCVARGHRFRSGTDSEVIIHLYEDFGPDCIADLEGMFALAIWDEARQRLMLARDRAGKKPLFYHRSPRLLAFGSEMKALFAHPDLDLEQDPEAVPYYFLFGYVPHPSTFYKDVLQVEPGTWTTIGADGRGETRRYWRLDYPPGSDVRPVESRQAAAAVREKLTRAVERRLVSDVPLGAFLSGGLDSTVVVGLMSTLMPEPVKTFSIGFDGDPEYDETSYARLVADRFHTDHTEFRVTPSAIDLIDTLIWHHDGPFGDSSAVPTYLVSRLTREKVTVVLTGDGGDEVFAGYDRFCAALMAERIPAIAARTAAAVLSTIPQSSSDRHPLSRAQRFVASAGLPIDERLAKLTAIFFDDLEELLRPDFAASLGPIDRLVHLRCHDDAMNGRSALSRLLYANFTSYLHDDLLVKTDRCTMASSLEARSPFLDRELVEAGAALPDDCKLRGRQTKSILRAAFADLVPDVIQRRPKMGFGVPLGAWFRGELKNYVRDLLFDPGARYRQFLSGPFVERLVARQRAGEPFLANRLWSVICFEQWLRLLPQWSHRGSVRL